ncbi:Beta-ketoacyl-[acyl-carrier-protein] synthase FabY [invertebrate metagenome]|uniref:Beta-ketoacyl-[acyl-carrier-protein] synthase FabY n=1 Tax=invertebrate metagenome TaxID=1711999 RepID=A0A2H9TBA5_9ZZZZ
MSALPVIVAQGGISSAGRTSGFHGYRRLVLENLTQTHRQETLDALKALMGSEKGHSSEAVIKGTLVRHLNDTPFDSRAIYGHHSFNAGEGSEIIMRERDLPRTVPSDWIVECIGGGQVKVRMGNSQRILVPVTRQLAVNAVGQLPDGFDPEKLYPSRNHPRGLSMTVYGASDAVCSSGLDWDWIKSRISPDQVSVYAGSSMSQLDYKGNGGMLQARLLGKRVTSKQCPLGFAEMPADFINAYILGSLGNTGTSMGACATLLYNLQMAVADIRTGRARLAIIGNSEAAITPEVMEGYTTMKALASDDGLRKLDGLTPEQEPDFRRACRPFGENCGFTLAESAQFLVLMDDALAIECGAQVLGSVADVFVSADGFKKSISSPGAGNYLTVARAVALGKAIAGESVLKNGSFIQAHGTGTPQNRVTESHILNEMAKNFGIQGWPVSAVKSYVGHSLGAAGGDQIMSTLGVWQYGWIPAIKTIDGIASDVSHSELSILRQDQQINPEEMGLGFINAKGFGGNNATAVLLSPDMTGRMLKARHGEKTLTDWRKRQEPVVARQQNYEADALNGQWSPVYQFGSGVLDSSILRYDNEVFQVPGYGKSVSLIMENPYWSF